MVKDEDDYIGLEGDSDEMELNCWDIFVRIIFSFYF